MLAKTIFIQNNYFNDLILLFLLFRRSTKSEKISLINRGPEIESEPYYCLPVQASASIPWSQPTSPTPPTRGFASGILSPTHNPSHRLTYPRKNEDGKLTELVSSETNPY